MFEIAQTISNILALGAHPDSIELGCGDLRLKAASDINKIKARGSYKFVITVAISVFLITFSTFNLSFSNKASAQTITDVNFGGASGLSFLGNKALQSWYGQCLASLGNTTPSTTLSSSIFSSVPGTNTNPLIGGGVNNGLTANADICAQQLQSYISQLLNAFQQCVTSAMIGSGLGGGGSTFVNAMQLCTLELQQQQGVASLQSPNGITNNGLFSTNTITTNPATTTNSFTQFPATTTSNGNFGPFQNLNPGFTSNSNNPLVSSNGVTTIP